LALKFSRQNNYTYSTAVDLRDTLRREIGLKCRPYEAQLLFHHDNILNTAAPVGEQFVQLYIRADIWQRLALSRRWSAVSWFESDQYLNARNQRASLYAGAAYSPFPGVEIMPLAGYSLDTRDTRFDKGFSPALYVRMKRALPDSAAVQSTLFVRTKDIKPRFQENIVWDAQLNKTFGEQSDISLRMQAGRNEMNDYRDLAIEKIIADTLAPTISVRYAPSRRLEWRSDNTTALTRRRFNYVPLDSITRSPYNDLSYIQTYLRTRQEANYTARNLRLTAAYNVESTIRRYDIANDQALSALAYERLLDREKQKDFRQRLFLTDIQAAYTWRKAHTLTGIFQNRYLQYDTPSQTNFDDHDELSYTGSLGWAARWKDGFSTSYKIIGSVRQYAFLFKERSQDNYTQRNLRTEFTYRWQPAPRLFLRGEQFIYVTYNVKDFADYNFTNRSTRNLESKFNATWNIRPRQSMGRTMSPTMNISLYRKEIHSSYLNWLRFSETTLDTTVIYLAELTQSFSFGKSSAAVPAMSRYTTLEVGYKHFQQLRFQNTSMTDLANRLQAINLHINNLQSGPVTNVRHTQGRNSVQASVWWQVQHLGYRYQPLTRAGSPAASYRESDLVKPQTSFRPFVSLTMGVRL